MKYLFLDTEVATSKGSKKICEFGYVITNESFDILERNNFIINPNIKRSDWDWYVVKNILSRKVREYEDNLEFDKYYLQIDSLINSVDYVFGHSINGDVMALNDECIRYNLPSINFDFYDIKEIFKEYSGAKRDVSVLDILKELEIESEPGVHDAEVDSVNTMYCLAGMLNKLEFSLDELFEFCPNLLDSNNDFVIESLTFEGLNEFKKIEKIAKDKGNLMFSHTKQRKLFNHFLKKLNIIEKKDDCLNGIKVSISLNYEEHHFKQMFKIVTLLHEKGAKYITKASESDYFVEYPFYDEEGNLLECVRAKYVNEAIQKGKDIKVIPFVELMNMLGITEEELDEMPIVTFENSQKRKVEKPSIFSTNIGELYKELLLG